MIVCTLADTCHRKEECMESEGKGNNMQSGKNKHCIVIRSPYALHGEEWILVQDLIHTALRDYKAGIFDDLTVTIESRENVVCSVNIPA